MIELSVVFEPEHINFSARLFEWAFYFFIFCIDKTFVLAVKYNPRDASFVTVHLPRSQLFASDEKETKYCNDAVMTWSDLYLLTADDQHARLYLLLHVLNASYEEEEFNPKKGKLKEYVVSHHIPCTSRKFGQGNFPRNFLMEIRAPVPEARYFPHPTPPPTSLGLFPGDLFVYDTRIVFYIFVFTRYSTFNFHDSWSHFHFVWMKYPQRHDISPQLNGKVLFATFLFQNGGLTGLTEGCCYRFLSEFNILAVQATSYTLNTIDQFILNVLSWDTTKWLKFYVICTVEDST